MSSQPDLYELYRQQVATQSVRQPTADDARGWLWLAALPSWNADLADAMEFPAAPNLQSFIQSTSSIGWCERTDDERPDGTTRLAFWVAPTRRREVLSAVQEHLDELKIEDEIRQLAGGLAKARPTDVGAVPAVRFWHQLLPNAKASLDTATQRLARQIASSVAVGDTATALGWLQAGDALAAVLGEPIAGAVSRGRRRIAREYRRVVDQRRLSRYLVRGDQRDALRALLDQPDQATPEPGVYWALHVVGMGGVGKTMLVRYLASTFAAPQHDERPAVARIDFDRVDPFFPSVLPGELLLALANDLAFESPSEAVEGGLKRLETSVRKLHRRIAERGAPPAFDETGRLSKDMLAAVDAFCRLCGLIADDRRRVVLVLDTCEELAKHHPPGEPVVSIERTFDLLTAIHEREPRVRVLFAGRRLLARRGHDWEADLETALPETIVSLKDRPFLAMLELRGFTDDEVGEYIRKIRKLKVDDSTVERMIAASADVGRVQGLKTHDDGERRPHPFDIDLFATIFEEDGSSATFDVNSYVRSRVVGRLELRRLEQVLPAVALLGRFDEAMIRAYVGDAGDAELTETVRRLGEQEWIDGAVDDRGVQWLTVEPGLRDRLVAYFEDIGEMAAVRAALGPSLVPLVRHGNLGDVDLEHLVWAVRLLEPSDALRVWSELEDRSEGEAGWPLLARAAERLLGRDDYGRIDTTPFALESLLRLAQIAHSRRQPDHQPVPGQWQKIRESASRLPDAAAAAIVGARAEIGILAESWDHAPAAPDPQAAVERLFAAAPYEPDPRLAAAVVAALDRLLDRWLDQPVSGSRGLPQVPLASIADWFDRWSSAMDPHLRAFAHTVVARYAAASGTADDATAALYHFEAAESDALEAPDGDDEPRRWADWVPPHDLVARIHLHWLLYCWRSGFELPYSVDDWEFDFESFDIDVERLASLGLQVSLALETPDDALVNDLLEAGRSPQLLRPQCLAHRQVPPLTVSAAETLAQRGDPMEALALLEKTVAFGTSSSGQIDPGEAAFDVAVDALRAAIRIVRAWRLDDEAWVLRRASAIPALRTAVGEARALLMQPQLNRPPNTIGPTVDVSELDATTGERPTLDISLGLYAMNDAEQVSQFLREIEGEVHRGFGSLHELDRLDRLWVGMLVCGADDTSLPSRLDDYTRRFSLLAQEEAEIIALRWPERGATLLALVTDRVPFSQKTVGFMAELTQVMAGLRAGHTFGTDRADDLLIAYQRAAPTRVKESDDGALSLETSDAGPLAGLENRLTATIAALRDPASVSPGEGLCAELVFVAPQPDAPAPRKRAAERLAENLAEIGASLFAALVVIAVWAGIVFAYRVLREWITGDAIGWWDAFGEISIGIWLIATPIYLFSRLRSPRHVPWIELRLAADWTPDNPKATVDVFARARAEPSNHIVTSAMRSLLVNTIGVARARSANRHWAGRYELEVNAETRVVGWSLHELLAPAGPRRVGVRRARRHVVVFGLVGDADELGWEMWRVGEGEPERVHHIREVFAVVDADPPRRPAKDVVIVAERSLQSVATRGWANKQRSVRTCTKPEDVGRVNGGVLHLVGLPVLTQTGWWLRVDDERPGIKVAEAIGAEILIGSEHLDVRRSSLVVVQGRPDHPFDDESLAGLRTVATDIAASAGAGSVVVIPPLPLAVAGQVVKSLGDMVFDGRSSNRRRDLLLWTRELRSIVNESGLDFAAIQIMAVTHAT